MKRLMGLRKAAPSPIWPAEVGGRRCRQPGQIRKEAATTISCRVVGFHRFLHRHCEEPNPPTRPEFVDAVIHWTPVISPSGMLFYSGKMFPAWKGSMLIGGLSGQALVRIKVDGRNASEVERLDMDARIRDVEEAPDGSLYLLTDYGNGRVLRLSRADG